MDAALLEAEGLGLRTRRGWVFRDLDLSVRAGEIVALTGPAGGGRTSALLALGGRFRFTHGRVGGPGRTAFGLVPGVNEPEPGLTVAGHLGERLRLLGRTRPWHRLRRLTTGPLLADLPPGIAPGTLARDLAPLDRHRLMIRLALLEDPDVLLLDDLDVSLTPTETQTLLSELDATGRAAVFTCRTPDTPLGRAPSTPTSVNKVPFLSLVGVGR